MSGEPPIVRRARNLRPYDVLGVSRMTGQPVTLAEAVAAAGARVAADKLIPGAATPDFIVQLAKMDLYA